MGRVEDAIKQFREGVVYKEQSGVPYPALKVDLGYALMLNGKKREAEALARYFGANDQLPPEANQLEMLRKKFGWKLGALEVVDDKNGYRYSEIGK